MSATEDVRAVASVVDPRTPTLHRRLRSHPATTTTTTHAPRRHLDPTGHRDDVCEPDGVASMSVGDTEHQMGIDAQDAAPLAAHVAATVDMEAIEARNDINGASPWPLRCPRQNAPSEAVAAAPLARPQDVPSEVEAAAPLARPREEEACACGTV